MAIPESDSIRPLKRSEYDALIAQGAFENERIELIDGALVYMSPIKEPHNRSVTALTELLVLALAGRAWVRPQCSFAASELSEPEPDLCVVPRDKPEGLPEVALLVIEVAESSLAFDRGRKARLYAESAIPEYWVVNLREGVVEVHTDPASGHYRKLVSVGPGERITLVAFPDVSLSVEAFF
ncbi:MAG TPA: Uma2 family endonuclease [Polyangiaceae bacterium]|jgi:Uma2 family endonuclease